MRVVVVSHDITDRKQAEQWERIAATAFESQQGMFITDASGIICGSTRRSPKSPATPPRRASGRRPGSSVRVATTRLSIARCAKASNGPAPGRVKSGTGARTTKSFPEWLTITAVKDGEGRVTHYVSTLSDITLRKAAQEEIQHLAFYDPLTACPTAVCCTTACASP
jgi:PAS domain-containing protein